MSGETAIFSIHDKKDYEIHEIVQQVYDALKEKGYNPVNQLVGYILFHTMQSFRDFLSLRVIISGHAWDLQYLCCLQCF